MSNCDVITSPIKFLGATVLSFNSTLGLGNSESTLTVDLIEDCDDGDSFMPKNGVIFVGAPVYFNAGSFIFGGVLTSWNVNQGPSGLTYQAIITDPRQLLENAVVVIDSYLGPPSQSINYFNVYNFIEGQVLQGNCSVFGSSLSNERGMPYKNIIMALQQMNPTIYSPTGYQYVINFNSFPTGIPDYFRVPGPSITILQLLQNICDVLGFEFYVNLNIGGIIEIGLIDLKTPPVSFGTLVASYNGIATQLSYGQELRNEVTKTVLFGEKQHYLSKVNLFNHFFGEDLIDDKLVPVIPFATDECGFWIKKKIDSLNSMLNKPLILPEANVPLNGPFELHELDIRCAMSSINLWLLRVLDKDVKGTFNLAIQKAFPEAMASISQTILAPIVPAEGRLVDQALNPRAALGNSMKPDIMQELEIIYNWVRNLGNTFYGKQFIVPLNQKICYYQLENNILAEKFFSDIPTNEGGWVDDGTQVIGLNDPELSVFRQEDNRIVSFAMFNISGDPDSNGSNTIGESESSFGNTSPTTPSTPTS